MKLILVFGADNERKIVDDPQPIGRKANGRECGDEFVVKKGKQIFCSNECRVAPKNRRLYASRHGEFLLVDRLADKLTMVDRSGKSVQITSVSFMSPPGEI